MSILKTFFIIILIISSSLCYAGPEDDVTLVNDLIRKNEVDADAKRTVEQLVSIVNHEVLVNISKQNFDYIISNLRGRKNLLSFFDGSHSSDGRYMVIRILEKIYNVDFDHVDLGLSLNYNHIDFYRAMNKSHISTILKMKEKDALRIIAEHSLEVISSNNIASVLMINNKLEKPVYKEIIEQLDHYINRKLLLEMEKPRFERLLKEIESEIPNYTDPDPQYNIIHWHSLFRFKSDSSVKIMAIIYNIETEDKALLDKMLTETPLESIYKMDLSTFNQTLTRYKPEDKTPIAEAETHDNQQISEPEEQIRFSGIRAENDRNIDPAVKRQDYYAEQKDNSVKAELKNYILKQLERLYPDETIRLKEFDKLQLTNNLSYAEQVMKEMYFELFDNGELSTESMNVLSNTRLITSITKELGLKDGKIGILNYLRVLMDSGTGELNKENANIGWKNTLDSFEQGLEQDKKEKENPITKSKMLELLSSKIREGKNLIKIVGEAPNSFPDQNIKAIINDARKAPTKAKEMVYLEEAQGLINAKQLNKIPVSNSLKDSYAEAEIYLNSGEKDTHLFNDRLKQDFNIEKNDIEAILNKLVDQKGVLDEKGIKILFGTKERGGKDSIYSQIQKYKDKVDIYSKFILLNLLVIGNNENIPVGKKAVSITEYMAKFMSEGHLEVFEGINSYDMRKLIEADVKLNIRETVKRTVDIERIMEQMETKKL